jgi:WD40 repeat protein
VAVWLTLSLGFAALARTDQATATQKEPKSYDRVGLNALAFTADGSLAVTGGREGVVSVWDLRRQRRWQTIRVGTPIYALALAPDGKLLAAGCEEKPGLRLWSRGADGFSALSNLPELWTCLAVALSPDGKRLAFGAEGHGTMHVYDLAAQRRIGRLWEPSNFTSALVFSPDGKRLASAGNDIICWDLSPAALLKTRPDREGQSLEELTAASAHALLWRAKHTDEYSADVAFSADGKLLAGVTGVGRLDTGGKTLRVWDAASGRLLHTIASEKMTCVAFLAGGKHLVTGHDDGRLTVWHLEEERSAREWQGHKRAVRAVIVVPGSSDLATVGADGAFQTWDPGTGRLKHRFSKE